MHPTYLLKVYVLQLTLYNLSIIITKIFKISLFETIWNCVMVSVTVGRKI